MVSQPENLGRGKSGERRIGDHLDELLAPPGPAFDLFTLGGRALVVPQQGRADHLVLLVEKHRAVHLTGEADRPDVGPFEIGYFDHRIHDLDRGFPPILWVLLAPKRLGVVAGVVGRGLGQNLALGVDGQRLGAGGANVDANANAHGEISLN